jgi:hypothetical protein
MLWETEPLGTSNPRKPYGRQADELYRTLKKIQKKFSREQKVEPFSPATGRYFPAGQKQRFSPRLYLGDPMHLEMLLLKAYLGEQHK